MSRSMLDDDNDDLQDENRNPEKKKPRGKPFEKGNKFGSRSKRNREKLSLSAYIKKKTNDGKALTDFYTRILKTIEENEGDEAPVYKGIKITPELANKGVDWLAKQAWGNPSQRQPEPEVDTRTEEQKLAELKYTLKEIGFDMVPIGSLKS